MLALDCPITTNVATISGFYSQMTGVLAGFAFTAIVVLLTPTQVDERRTSARDGGKSVLGSFFAAFIALVVATLNYAVLAGESMVDAPVRAYTTELVDGIPFGLATIMLFHGITLLLLAGRMDRLLVNAGRAFTVVVGPCLMYYYIVNGTSDTETWRASDIAHACVQRGPLRLGLVLTVILLIVLSLSMVQRVQPEVARKWAVNTSAVVPVVVLFVVVAVAVVGGTLGVRDRRFIMSPTALNTFLVCLFVLLLALGLHLSLGLAALAPAGTREDLPIPRQNGDVGAPATDVVADGPADAVVGAVGSAISSE